MKNNEKLIADAQTIKCMYKHCAFGKLEGNKYYCPFVGCMANN